MGQTKVVKDYAHCEATVMGQVVVKGHWYPGMS